MSHERDQEIPTVRIGISGGQCIEATAGIIVSAGDVYDLAYKPIAGDCTFVRLDTVAFALSARPGLRCFDVRTERGFFAQLLSLDDPVPDANDPIIARVVATKDGGDLGTLIPQIVEATKCGLFGGGTFRSQTDNLVYQLECVAYSDSVFPEGSEYRSLINRAAALEERATAENPLTQFSAAAASALGDFGRLVVPLLIGAAVLALAIHILSKRGRK